MVIRNCRHGRAQNRQADRFAAEEPAGRSPGRGGRLELSEPLLKAVLVASRKIVRLLDDSITRDAAPEGAELRVETLDFGRSEVGELLEAGEAEPVKRIGELGPDTFDQAQVVMRVR